MKLIREKTEVIPQSVLSFLHIAERLLWVEGRMLDNSYITLL